MVEDVDFVKEKKLKTNGLNVLDLKFILSTIKCIRIKNETHFNSRANTTHNTSLGNSVNIIHQLVKSLNHI